MYIQLFVWDNTSWLFYRGATFPSGPRPPYYRGFTIILRHTTLGRTSLDKWSARHTDKRQTSMPPAGFEHTIPASQRQQTYALDSRQYVAYCCLILGPAILGKYFDLQPSASGRARNYMEMMYYGKYDEIRHTSVRSSCPDLSYHLVCSKE